MASVIAAIALWWKLLKHRHTWTVWTDWVASRESWGATSFIRERYCETCQKTTRQEIGSHECAERPCQHKDIFVAAFDKGVAIKNIEKELGL
jgi:hypothetical protein